MSGPASLSLSCQAELLQNGRRNVELRNNPDKFTIAGVTFEGRQELIRALQPLQSVLLEREPYNPHDPSAVRVVDLLGRTLGYIPRKNDQNARFKYERGFAVIAGAGLAGASGKYGASLYARPTVPCLTLDPFPLAASDSWRHTEMAATFKDRWPQLQATTLAAAGHRCEVTGLSHDELPLLVVPQWRYNSAANAAQLVGLMALSQPLAEAKARLERGVVAAASKSSADMVARSLEELQQTPDGQLFAELNGISAEDATGYFKFELGGTQSAMEQGWRTEVLL
ncbi:hypothetical protein GPECTOR_1g669 [Gonium pectorale]|uniref:HIRAN domain-containing protein n=1 Tax=Gonium pectorale TaxID=33097 RepID=A0A150H3X0_GONPE|nr:hypothetical protein GPECTOR_1g669 [Gonium pectorale]|eukprot:KXZ56742.1 hypothetical protein GPECTOR_1g669 [Gonium pectorale]